MPNRQPAQQRARRQPIKSAKGRWTAAQRAERDRSASPRSPHASSASTASQGRTSQGNTYQGRTSQGRTSQGRTYQSRTYQSRTSQGSTPAADHPPRADRREDVRGERTRGPRPDRPREPSRSERVPTEGDAGPVTAPTPRPAVGFAQLGLPAPLVAGLAEAGITTTFPIQAATIPDALAGRDVLGRGQTGSGKTLAFGLPVLARLAGSSRSRRPRQARAVVLVPTRELAMQVTDALAPLARTLELGIALVAGGMSYTPQLRAFERGVDVVVATPGRLLDLMERGAADLGEVEITVLDEADHMADLGFLPAVTAVLDTAPAGTQHLLFSATLDNAVGHLVETYLDRPVTHEIDSGRASVTTMDHRIVHVRPQEKQLITAEIAGREGRTVVFARTQLGAERIADQLRASGVLAGALHGGLSQSVRTRILGAFKDGGLPVLVATDVAARGIHVDEVGLVLQVDPPAGPKEYLHRAGRTARAGGKGVVVTLVLPQQRREVSRLAAQAGISSEPMRVGPGDPQLAEVTGAQPPSGAVISRADYDRVIAPRRPARSSGARRSGGRAFRADRPGRPRRGSGPGERQDGRWGAGPRP